MADTDVVKIRVLNDHARRTFTGCRVVVTCGITALGNAALPQILRLVQQFNQFTADNDPYGEHDFGRIVYAGTEIFWKWDYYDPDFSMRSPDPSDPTVTSRVLTVMLAEEY
jgi:hypothetical protein